MKRLVMAMGMAGLLLGFVALPGTASAAVTEPLGWGDLAGVSWTQHDPNNLLHLPGNTYSVDVAFEENLLGRFVRGGIGMYRCKPGEVIGGIDPGPGQCAYLGTLTLDGTKTTTVTYKPSTGSATLVGQMMATRDDGSAAGSVPVAMSWTGSAISSQSVYLFGFSAVEGTQYTIRGWRRNWTATAAGTVGKLNVGAAGNELVSAGTARYSVKSYTLVG
jgi:hypothetical protein